MTGPAEADLLAHLRTIRPLWRAFVETLDRRDRLRAYLRIQALPDWQRHEIQQRLTATEEHIVELDRSLTPLERKTPELDQRAAEEAGLLPRRRRDGRPLPLAPTQEPA